MPNATGTIPGPHDEHQILFYGLSTCVWCKRTRQFLESQGVKFDFVYVDLLGPSERQEILEEIRRRSGQSSVSFPTVMIDGGRCVVGYRPEQMREVLRL